MDVVGAELDDLLAEFESTTLIASSGNATKGKKDEKPADSKKEPSTQAKSTSEKTEKKKEQPVPKKLAVKTSKPEKADHEKAEAKTPEPKPSADEILDMLEYAEEEEISEETKQAIASDLDVILGEFEQEAQKQKQQPQPVKAQPTKLSPQPQTLQPTRVTQPPAQNTQPQPQPQAQPQPQPQSQSPQLQRQQLQPQRQQLQPQNLQPQNSQPQNTVQPQNSPQQPRNLQPQNTPQPQNQPQNLQPRNLQPQNLQPQNLQPRNLQPQNVQNSPQQPRNLQPQNLQPQNLQPRNAQPQPIVHDPEAQLDSDYAPSTELTPEAKLEAMQFIRLPNTPLPYDMDGNTASDFKISGTTNTEVAEVHSIILRPLNKGVPVPLINPQKYISVELNHSSNVVLLPWWRDNQDNTYSFGFCSLHPGVVTMKIKLCGTLLFALDHNISPGGEEKNWVARCKTPLFGRPWKIDIMRADGARPPGMHPFQVEIQGPLDNFKLADLGGVYQVSTVPSAIGYVRVYIKLYGKDIVGSPVTMEVTELNEYPVGGAYLPPNVTVLQPVGGGRTRGVADDEEISIGAPSNAQPARAIGHMVGGGRPVSIVTPRGADDALADLLDELEQY